MCYGRCATEPDSSIYSRHQSMKKLANARLRLGNILVATGKITRAQLANALARARRSGKQLGAELVDAGYLTSAHLASGLHLQRRMRVSAAIAVALAAGTPAGSITAEAAETASAKVTVSATVLRHASVRVLTAPQTLSISEADIARGYVDVPVPSRLEIRSNSPSGYVIAIESAADFSRGTEVRGLGDMVSFGPFGGVLHVKGGGHGMNVIPVELNYRVLLSDVARPGVHPWPVQLSVMPL